MAVRPIIVLAMLGLALASESEVSWEYTPLKDMKMHTGDMISCRLTGFLFANTHWMLASNDGHLIMVWPGSDGYYVEETHYSRIISSYTGVDWNRCWNYGMGGAGGGSYVLERARRHLNKKIYYHLLTCNCEHYVKWWAQSDYNVNQSGSRASSYCSFFQAVAKESKLSPNDVLRIVARFW